MTKSSADRWLFQRVNRTIQTGVIRAYAGKSNHHFCPRMSRYATINLHIYSFDGAMSSHVMSCHVGFAGKDDKDEHMLNYSLFCITRSETACNIVWPT